MATWLDDMLASLQQGNTPGSIAGAGGSPFPEQPPPVDEAAMAEAARQAAGEKLMRANQRRINPFGMPAQDSAGIQLAMDQAPPGTGVPNMPFSMAPPSPDGSPFGAVPPSLALAQKVAAPPPVPSMDGGPPQMQPQAPIAGLNAPIGGMKPPVAPPVAADTPTEASAARRMPPAPMGIAGAPAPGAEPSGWRSFGEGLTKASPMLLAMSAGFGGAPSFSAGMGRAAGEMAPIALAQQKEQQALALQTQKENITANALLKKGVPAEDVAAAKRSQEILKALVAEHFGRNKYKIQEVGSSEDEFGNKTKKYAAVNENDPTDFKPIVNGRITDISSSGRTTSKNPDQVAEDNGIPTESTAGGYLAPGVGSVDHSKSGDEYLNQYSPEFKAAVKNYISGETMPTANPRKGWIQNVKAVAQKYGSDVGMPVDDATFAARRTMRNDLAKSSPSTIGGQIGIGNTALGHLADMSKQAVGLGNVDIGLAGPSHLINDIRGMTSAQAAKMEALKGAAQHYGQEVTKFYSGSPGGEAERNRFLETVNGAKTPQELAAVIETEAALMQDRVKSLESNIRTTLGEEATKKYPVIRAEGQRSLDEINGNVSKLRGGKSEIIPPAGPLKPGKYVWSPDKGLVPQ